MLYLPNLHAGTGNSVVENGDERMRSAFQYDSENVLAILREAVQIS
jgi:hypothetical protein